MSETNQRETNFALGHWTGGQLLAFSGIDGNTDYENGLTLRTAFSGIALEVKLPGLARIEFQESNHSVDILAGDHFSLSYPSEQIRGVYCDAYHFLIEGSCKVSLQDEKLQCVTEGNRTLIGTAHKYDNKWLAADIDSLIEAREEWITSLKSPKRLTSDEEISFLKAASQVKTMIYSPEGIFKHRYSTPDRWPHRGMWLWDSAFHAIGIRHLDASLAREILMAVFDGQRDDGFISIRCNVDGRASEYTQPPVLCLAVEKILESMPDKAWLEKIFPKLEAYIEWDLHNRDTDGYGLLEWQIEGNPLCRSGESGMDNSSRFDEAVELDATDFNAFVTLECELLSKFAKTLGLSERAQYWSEKHQSLCNKINERLWNEEQGFYLDYNCKTGKQSPVMSSSGFLPLICGAPSQKMAERLVAHLKNPQTFGTALRVASIAVNQPESYAKDMWRGPVWININWLIIAALKRYGFDTLAKELHSEIKSEIEQYVKSHGTFFEFFDDRKEVEPPKLLRKGSCDPEKSPFNQVFHDYGWTATLYLDLLLA